MNLSEEYALLDLHFNNVRPLVSDTNNGVRSPDPKTRAELANEFRKTIAQIVAGLLITLGVYATWRRVAAAERAVEVAQRHVLIAQEQQITERFTRATEQLGDDKEPIILGGVYALERIARDSHRDH